MPTPPVELERIPTPPVERPERQNLKEYLLHLLKPERIPISPVEPEIPPLVDPSVFMDNAEVITPLITRCDKGTQTLSPYLHVQRLDLGKRRLEPPLAPKRLKQNPRRVQTTLFCGCLDIILSWPWATMDSLFNPPM
ncbi:hypothetical protein TNCV_2991041 [Trichonephila clavipes]|nr:hypothetical protein TNCV_2991041 [Trichonephila clavipes]